MEESPGEEWHRMATGCAAFVLVIMIVLSVIGTVDELSEQRIVSGFAIILAFMAFLAAVGGSITGFVGMIAGKERLASFVAFMVCCVPLVIAVMTILGPQVSNHPPIMEVTPRQ